MHSLKTQSLPVSRHKRRESGGFSATTRCYTHLVQTITAPQSRPVTLNCVGICAGPR